MRQAPYSNVQSGELQSSLDLLKSYYAGEIKEPNHDAIDDAYSVMVNFLNRRGIDISKGYDHPNCMPVSEQVRRFEQELARTAG